MAFLPTTQEINSKDNIRWIANLEAGDESVANRPIDDVANFANTIKTNAIYSDPSKKGLTQQTISSPLLINSYIGLSGGTSGGVRFSNGLGDANDSSGITLTSTSSNQILKITSLNDASDEIHLETASSTSLKANINNGTDITTHTIWHEGNHGQNSGLDADLVHGLPPSSVNAPSTIVSRNAAGNFNANVITANKFEGDASNVTDIVTAQHGGTGFNSYTKGDILIANGSSSFLKVSTVGTNSFLTSTGPGEIPVWRKLRSTDIEDGQIFPTSVGGTGTTGITGLMFGNGSSPVTVAIGSQITNIIGNEFVQNANFATLAGNLVSTNSYTATQFNGISGISNILPLANGNSLIGISTKAAREDHVHPIDSSRADNSAVVHLTGNETIQGNKTFVSPIIGTTINQVSKIGNETIAGIKTFGSSPIIPTPTTEYQASTKKYVDDKFSWDGTVLRIQVTPGVWKQVYPPIYQA
jgi:hypothetical protein